jgi:hypothetical protein
MNKLVKFNISCGRMGSLYGQRVYDDRDWKTLRWLIDNKIDVYFGEVLGKHSEIVCCIDDGDYKIVTENQDFLNTAQSLKICLGFGHCPVESFIEQANADLDSAEAEHLETLKELGINWDEED